MRHGETQFNLQHRIKDGVIHHLLKKEYNKQSVRENILDKIIFNLIMLIVQQANVVVIL